MVNVLLEIAKKIEDDIPGIQVEYERSKVAVGDRDAVVLVNIKTLEAGLFGRAHLASVYSYEINIFTRMNARGFWYEVAENVIKSLTGFKIRDDMTELRFLGLVFEGYRDGLYSGYLKFENRSFKGGL